MVVLLLRAIKQQLQPHTVSWCQAQNWDIHQGCILSPAYITYMQSTP